MTRQEKLEEEIKEWVLEIRQYLCNTEFSPEPFTKPVDLNVLTIEFPRRFLKFLDDNGVVIKVERELPDNEMWHKVEREFEAYCAGRNDILKWHEDSLEPLIKEVKGVPNKT